MLTRSERIKAKNSNWNERMLDEDPHAYTIPGRLLMLVAIVLPIAATSLEILWRGKAGASGIAMPALVLRNFAGGLVVFGVGGFLMRKLGIAFRKDDVRVASGAFVALQSQQVDSAMTDTAGPRFEYCSSCKKEVELDDDDRCVECRWTI